ncbi:hypothetical protein [Paracoccus rhizosphaerae]|uniref:Uncharacterized protein n=1 Tax=Paracoccus rhizosphaerae TaxID=1133347 RepID=A0ABV6CLL4_9RHOB|nr:hypothetical protein [Paracoccus rhizosphaerae]
MSERVAARSGVPIAAQLYDALAQHYRHGGGLKLAVAEHATDDVAFKAKTEVVLEHFVSTRDPDR